MRRILMTALLAFAPAVVAQQPVTPATPAPQSLPRDVRRTVVERWNGSAEFRASDRADIGATSEVRGNVAVLRGPLTISGHVIGSVLVINGDLILRPMARIEGELLVVGGDVEGLSMAHVEGPTRIYRQSLAFREEGDRIVALNEEGGADEENWWRRFERRREGNWSQALRVVQAGPYNRVEGLPIQLGPAIQQLTPWGSVRLDAAAIVRTATTLSSDGDDIGHAIRGEVRVGREKGIGFGGQLFNEIEPVEAWQLSNVETALAAFLARHDYRDYYQRHGARGSLTLYGARNLSLTASYGKERWASRAAENPFSLFNTERNWRENPRTDEGVFHLGDLALSFDTRTDPMDPWSGWYLNADLEHGKGTIEYARPLFSGGFLLVPTKSEHTRAFFDFRRYNRLGPSAQLNMRLLAAGWLGGDSMPLERRLSVDGPGAIPGFGFRSMHGGIDTGNCNEGDGLPGRPAQCDRILLGQVEYRGDIKLPLIRGWQDWPRRYRTSHGDVSWVVFADAGRGWRIGPQGMNDLSYSRGSIPPLSTFRSDVGIGLDVAGVGIYGAKAVSSSEPANFFVRLRHRF
jgi:hypothetical protein